MYLKEGYQLHTGKYLLHNVIGEGGFSITYKGLWNTDIHGPLGKIATQAPVCIKEYFFKDYCLRNELTNFIETNSANGKLFFDKYKEKIIKEARILSDIHHPNVVKVLEVFKQNNTVYIVMEFISGDSLKQILEQSGVFKEETLLPILFKIGQALQYIHEKNILHLDIKPSNILMDTDNNPKLIDFGISKRYDIHDRQETSTSILAASKGYASIEQYDSEGMQFFSPCPDIYSFGATMYFLLTGEVPTESILRSTKGLARPRELNPEISENTERVILKAMELHASNRYQSVIEMITDLGYNPETEPKTPPKQEDERTELLPSVRHSINQPIDVDEETRIHTEQAKNKKEINRKAVIFSGIGLIAVTITLLILYLNRIFTPHDSNRLPNTAIVQTDTTLFNPADTGQTTPPDDAQPADNPVSASEVDKGNKEKQPEDDPNRQQYEHYYNSALAYFNAKDYSNAASDFRKAVSYMDSPEAKKYISICDSELEAQAIEKRKEMYDFKMEFGNFVIVKKKSNGLMGAVDQKCHERIPCIYLLAEPAGENRAFLREDELFDIYSPSGDTIKTRADSY